MSTVADFKSWLAAKYSAGTPVVLYYQLATEEDTDLTEITKTIPRQTNIELTSNDDIDIVASANVKVMDT